MDDMDQLFGDSKNQPWSPREKWEYHTLKLIMLAGEGEYPNFKVECKGGDKDDCSCTDKFCTIEDQIKMVGLFDVIRVEEEFDLVTLDARMDFTDPEEPWVEVKLQ